MVASLSIIATKGQQSQLRTQVSGFRRCETPALTALISAGITVGPVLTSMECCRIGVVEWLLRVCLPVPSAGLDIP